MNPEATPNEFGTTNKEGFGGFMSIPVFVATKCGHRTGTSGLVTAFGKTTMMTMPIQSDGTVEFCIRCIEEMAIKCDFCGKVIFIGDVVSVFHWNSNSEEKIGCLRTTCCLASEASGRWLPGEDSKGGVRYFSA